LTSSRYAIFIKVNRLTKQVARKKKIAAVGKSAANRLERIIYQVKRRFELWPQSGGLYRGHKPTGRKKIANCLIAGFARKKKIAYAEN